MRYVLLLKTIKSKLNKIGVHNIILILIIFYLYVKPTYCTRLCLATKCARMVRVEYLPLRNLRDSISVCNHSIPKIQFKREI